jgi:hypothetical protein
MINCFMCGIEIDGQLTRTTLPKELLGKDEHGNLSENPKPICQKCYYFKRVVDQNFTRLCEEGKLYELYRSKSKKRGEFFPTELVYNVDVEKLLELYYHILDICEIAYRISTDDAHRKAVEDELNYNWRKRDE